MGMFGSIGRALTGAGSDGLSLLDRAAIFATAAGGDTQTALALRGLPAQRQKLQQQQAFDATLMDLMRGSPGSATQAQIANQDGEDITAGFAPQMDVTPGRAPLNINSPELGAVAYQGGQLGRNMSGLLDVLKAQAPEYDYVNGQRIVKRGVGSGANPEFIAKLGEGMRPGAGGTVENAPGYVKSAAESAGAVMGAQEAAKAGYDMVEVKIGGSVVQLPRSVALPLITAAFGQANPNGLPADFGRTVSPEEQALRTGRAANTVKQEGMLGEATVQAGLDLPKVRDQAMNTLNVLDKIRAHPSLPDRTGNSTLLPAIRPQDVDFDTMVSQIGGGAFLEAIQSLKGTGQITEIEGKKATDAIARMQNQRQSEAGFRAAMDEYEAIVRKGLSRTERRAGASPRPSLSSVPVADRMAEARRRGLIP